MTANWARSLIALPLVLVLAAATTGPANAQTPTSADIENALRATWEKPASTASPRTGVEVKSIRIGATDKATAQEVVDGIPRNAQVTAALIDFVVRTYHSNTTRAVRRVREARVYKDKFGEWAVMTGQARGQDQSWEEPARK